MVAKKAVKTTEKKPIKRTKKTEEIKEEPKVQEVKEPEEIKEVKEVFKMVLRLITSKDNLDYKNSIITFMKIVCK